MCLLTPNKEVKIASEDITTYKVLTKDLQAVFFDKQYKLDVLYETEIQESSDFSVVGSEDFDWFGNDYNKVEDMKKSGEIISLGEGFHSCAILESAERLLNDLSGSRCLVECTIPKGSEYYDSPFNYFVSNKIIVNKVIK